MFPLALIRPATTRDVDDVARLLARAFADPEPVTRWLVPDPVRHTSVMPTFFEVFAQDALTHGTIDLATDHDGTILGAGVWFDHTTPDPSGAAGGPDPRLDEAFGPDASRWQVLDAAMTATHPDAPHWYLFALGVRPDLHGHGIGTRLLDAAHHRIGDTRRPIWKPPAARVVASTCATATPTTPLPCACPTAPPCGPCGDPPSRTRSCPLAISETGP